MKKLLLSLAAVAMAYASNAQVVVAGVSPASIVGNYANTWAQPTSGWGTPDFTVPGTFIVDTLMMVEDGSTGTNAQGHPVSEEGCNPLINDLTGKIAVIYRNTCNFSVKALNAQNAGAVGVIIINRDADPIEMGAGTDGTSVTIPVVMVGNADGAALVNEMANGSVVMFIGNKTGLFANDLAMSASATLIPKMTAVSSFLAQNGSEFNFEVGARIYNPGDSAQTGVTLKAKIVGPNSSVVYDNTVSGLTIASGDSIDVVAGAANSLPQFSLATYPAGVYTLTYTVTMDSTDEYPTDNTLSSTFFVSDSLMGYAQIDPETRLAAPTKYYRPSTNNQTFSVCNVINDANASRVAVQGLYFAASNTTAALTGEEIALFLYKWEDQFTDLNDANFGFNTLTEVASSFYYFPGDYQDSTLFGAFTTPVVLEDNVRYLACVQTSNTAVYFGHEGSTDYTWNLDMYLQPQTPNESDGTYYATGFGSDNPNSVIVKVMDANNIGINEINEVAGSAYPNPATDKVTVSIEGEGAATLTVTDLSGRVAVANAINLVNGKAEVSTANLEAGMYIFNVVLENGKTAKFNVVKK